ncbi:MAG: hypothetical protein WA194_08015 [Patescibacteria group bacterium]
MDLGQIPERESAGIVDRTFETSEEFFPRVVGHGLFAGDDLHERRFPSAVPSNDGDSVVVVDDERSVPHENVSSGQFVTLYFDVQVSHGADNNPRRGFCKAETEKARKTASLETHPD